jgi:hypothetical protein
MQQGNKLSMDASIQFKRSQYRKILLLTFIEAPDTLLYSVKVSTPKVVQQPTVLKYLYLKQSPGFVPTAFTPKRGWQK